jgi:hypothetical protein
MSLVDVSPEEFNDFGIMLRTSNEVDGPGRSERNTERGSLSSEG